MDEPTPQPQNETGPLAETPPEGPQTPPEPPPEPEPTETPPPAPEPTTADPRLSELEARAEAAEARLAVLVERGREQALDLAVGQALAGLEFVNDKARDHAARLIRLDLEAADGDGFEVRHKQTGKTAAQVVGELVDAGDLDIFLRAEGRGGVTPGGNRGIPGPGPEPGSVGWFAEQRRREQDLLRQRRAGLPSYGWPGSS